MTDTTTNPGPITLPDGGLIELITERDDDDQAETRIVVTSARGAVKADVPMDRDSLIALSNAIPATMRQRTTTRRADRTE